MNIDKQVKEYDARIEGVFQSSEICRRLSQVEGVGPLTATAFVSSCGQPEVFKNGRECSAWLGLVPKQKSSGGKSRLLGISKRGNSYLRCLLIHGARSVIRCREEKRLSFPVDFCGGDKERYEQGNCCIGQQKCSYYVVLIGFQAGIQESIGFYKREDLKL